MLSAGAEVFDPSGYSAPYPYLHRSAALLYLVLSGLHKSKLVMIVVLINCEG